MIIELYKAGMEDCRTKMFDNLSFVSAPGDVVAITGGTLRGKSALLLSILGMKRLASGWASVDGEPVHPATSAYYRHFMSWVPQSFCFGTSTVRDIANSMLRLKINKGEAYSDNDVIAEFNSLGLSGELMSQRFSSFDNSQAQRVLLAFAGVSSRPVLLLDQPTFFQGEAERGMIAAYLRQPKFADTSIVVTTDDPLLLQVANKVVPLNE